VDLAGGVGLGAWVDGGFWGWAEPAVLAFSHEEESCDEVV